MTSMITLSDHWWVPYVLAATQLLTLITVWLVMRLTKQTKRWAASKADDYCWQLRQFRDEVLQAEADHAKLMHDELNTTAEDVRKVAGTLRKLADRLKSRGLL